jgi:PAS domain S-box-containing protein
MTESYNKGAATVAEQESREHLIARLAETEAWLRLFTEHVPVRACATDGDLRVVRDIGLGFADSPGPIGKTVGELFATSPDRDRVLEGCRRALQGETSELHIDDGEHSAHLRLTPRFDVEGRVVGVIGLAFDVTERTRAESGLREAQRLLREAQRIGRVRSWEEDLRTGVIKEDLAELVEPPSPLPREEAWKAVPIEERARLVELSRRTIEEGVPFEIEHRLVAPDGSMRTVVTRGELVRDTSGRPERILGSTLDITDRARVEEEVRVGRRLLQRVLETIPVGVVVVDPDASIVLSNPASARIWGGVIAAAAERYPLSKGHWHATGQPLAPEDWASMRALRKGETSLNELIDIATFDGRRRIIQNSAAPISGANGAIVGAVVVNEDVTERVRAEEALRRTQRLLVEAETLGATGSWEHDLVTGEIVDSEGNQRLFFGGGRGTHLFEDYSQVIHPDDRARVLSRRAELLAGEGPPDIEYRVIWPDGSVHHILGLATVVRDFAGRAVRVYGTNADITRRKRGEEERARLLESERRARAETERTLERLRAIQSITDLALARLAVDDLLTELLARLRKALEGDYAFIQLIDEKQDNLFTRAADGVALDLVKAVRVPIGQAVGGRIAADGKPRIVYDLSTADVEGLTPGLRTLLWGSMLGTPLQVEGRIIGVLSVATAQPRRFTEDDLRLLQVVADRVAPTIERSRLDEAMRAGRKQLQALSRRLLSAQEEERRRLAVELHDELGQVLTVVKINLASLERQRKAGMGSARLKEAIASVDQAMERVRDLALDLRPSVLDDLGLAAAVRWYADRFAKTAQVRAHLAMDVVPQLPAELETACFRVTQEALTNIARHARARNVWIDLHVVGAQIDLRIRDDGVGFDAALARERAIGGASMGLLGMQERVSLAGGVYELTTRPGGGTEVRVRLPLGTNTASAP